MSKIRIVMNNGMHHDIELNQATSKLVFEVGVIVMHMNDGSTRHFRFNGLAPPAPPVFDEVNVLHVGEDWNHIPTRS